MSTDSKTGKGLATLGAGIVCAVMLVMTDGEHGAGWFLLYLLLIW